MLKVRKCATPGCEGQRVGKCPCACCGAGLARQTMKVKSVMCVTKAHGFHAPTKITWRVAEGKAA